MFLENLVKACLTSREFDFVLPFNKNFYNVEICEKLRDEKIRIIANFETITNVTKLVDLLAKRFQIKLFVKKCNDIFISGKNGPELFFYTNSYGFVFHSNPAKVLDLPTGLNCCKGPSYKYSDFFSHEIIGKFLKNDLYAKSMDNSFIYDEQINDIEKSSKLGIEVWASTKSGIKHKFEKLRSTNCSPKKIFYLDKSFKILFHVTKPKLLFRGNMKKLSITI